VVTTTTGSRYFLSPEKPTKKANPGSKIFGSSPTITLTAQRKKIEEGAVDVDTPKATFSLFGMFGGGGDDDAEKKEPVRKSPTLSVPKAKPAPKKAPVPKPAPKKTPAPSKPLFGGFGGGGGAAKAEKKEPVKRSPTLTIPKAKPAPKKAPAPKPAPKKAPAPSKPLFGGFGGGGGAAKAEKKEPVKRSPTLTIPKAKPAPKKVPATKPAPKKAPAPSKPLFGGFGAKAKVPVAPSPQKKAPSTKKTPLPKKKPVAKKATPAAKQAPNGVPTISSWRKNADGSVSGNISNSPNFRNGERVTTSPIVRGRYSSGEVVTTGSGSRYFLA
jgi:hypothetical protein